MGMFLEISSVVGKNQAEVAASLANYAASVNGGLVQEDLSSEDKNCCVIKEDNGNTSAIYPSYFTEWDASAGYLSRELNAPVFSFHIHDGDLWMYLLYVNGVVVDQFNPAPDYWNDNLSEEEINSWKGDAATIIKYVPGIQKENIEKYLVRWDFEAEGVKAYPTDEFNSEDWQLLDFMKALNLPYPLDDDGNAAGLTYKLWTKDLKIETVANNTKSTKQKPWWRFW